MRNKSLAVLLAVLVLVLVLAAVPAAARTTYERAVSGVTSVTIPASESGFASSRFGVLVFDGGGVKQSLAFYSWTIDQASYSVTVNFAGTFWGVVRLVGMYDAFTSADRDFKLTRETEHLLYVCEGCSEASYAKRWYQGKSWAMDSRISIDVWGFSMVGYVGVYLDAGVPGVLVQVPMGYGGITCTGGCRVAQVASPLSGPAGSVLLGYATLDGGGVSSAVDGRPF